MTASQAETLALRAIAFIASNDDAIPRFLAQTGVDFSEMKERLGDPEVLAAAFDFLMNDESLARTFAIEENLTPEKMHAAHHLLAGSRGNS